MQSLNRGMKSLGLATGGLFSVEKMLGRMLWSNEGWLEELRFKEENKLEFWKGLEVGLLMLWPIVD